MSPAEERARELVAMGYRKVSNKYRTISRVDRSDWKEVLAKSHVRGMEWVNMFGDKHTANYYRRYHSRDTLTVSAEVLQHIPSSNWDPIGFVKCEDEGHPDWTPAVAGDLLPGDLINHPDTLQTVEILDIFVFDDGETALTLSRDTLFVHADDLVQLVNRRNQ